MRRSLWKRKGVQHIIIITFWYFGLGAMSGYSFVTVLHNSYECVNTKFILNVTIITFQRK